MSGYALADCSGSGLRQILEYFLNRRSAEVPLTILKCFSLYLFVPSSLLFLKQGEEQEEEESYRNQECLDLRLIQIDRKEGDDDQTSDKYHIVLSP